jgi:hypothetical protein
MSLHTTNLGPRVAVSASHGYAHGSIDLGTLDLTEAQTLVRSTVSSASSTVLKDGEFAVVSLAASAATLAFRSGNTVYLWSSTTAQAV